MAVEVIQIDDNTWRIEDDGHVRFFLLTGDDNALLIDSGMNVPNVKEVVGELTDLPLILINTHADRDHIGGNAEFDKFYMHPSEASNYYNTQKGTGEFIPIEEGDMIDLGNRPLMIIALPGHTPGSIAILDVNKKALISGDPIQDGLIFMFGVQREVHAYEQSLLKIKEYADMYDVIYPSHGTFPVYPEIIDKLYDAVNDILAGKYVPTEAEFHGTTVNRFDTEVASFLMDK